MNAADINPVPPGERTQSPFDLFLIFAGANIVATTLQVGASLAPRFDAGSALGLIALGTVLGTALVAALIPLGPRLGVPSIVAVRAPLGLHGAGLVAVLLYLTNFAWIAVNDVIAASACARIAGGPVSERWWAVGLALLSTVFVAGGPRWVGRADRIAVPALLVVGGVMTIACLRLPAAALASTASEGRGWLTGLDIVIAYQVSWILIFSDYSRYTRSARKATVAAFLGLVVTSLWFMPLGWTAARVARSQDPGAMLAALGLGVSGAALMALATLTTNFVNIYLSSLAWKSLRPASGDQASIWFIGLVGAGLSLLSTAWLDRFAGFMLVLGSLLVPIGGVVLAHYFLMRLPVRVEALYDRHGPYARSRGFSPPALAAWAIGTAVYWLASGIGGTLPALATTIGVYWLGWRIESAWRSRSNRTAGT